MGVNMPRRWFGPDPVDRDKRLPAASVDDAMHVANDVNGNLHGSVVQAGRVDKIEQHVHNGPSADQASRWIFGTMPPRAGAFQNRRVATELDE